MSNSLKDVVDMLPPDMEYVVDVETKNGLHTAVCKSKPDVESFLSGKPITNAYGDVCWLITSEWEYVTVSIRDGSEDQSMHDEEAKDLKALIDLSDSGIDFGSITAGGGIKISNIVGGNSG